MQNWQIATNGSGPEAGRASVAGARPQGARPIGDDGEPPATVESSCNHFIPSNLAPPQSCIWDIRT